MKVSDAEVVRIMLDGALKVCDHAESCWSANKYSSDETIKRENLERWAHIRQRARELARQMGEILRPGSQTEEGDD